MGLLGNKDRSAEKVFNASNKDEAIAALEEFKNSILEEATENYNLYGGKKVGMTSESKKFYEGLRNNLTGVKQGVTDPYLPVKDVEDVLQNIKTDSKLVSAVKTMSTDRAVVDIVLNGGGADKATFKPLTEAIVKEITGKVKVARVTLEKLSAYFQIAQDLCRFQSLAYLKNLLDANLKEAMILALEDKIVADMIASQTTEEVVTKTAVTSFDAATMLPIVKQVLTDDNGRMKKRDKVFLACNNNMYFTKVLPAMEVVNVQGQKVNVFPYDVEVVVVDAVPDNQAVLFDAQAYQLVIGNKMEVTVSDDFKFLEDIKVAKAVELCAGLCLDKSARVLDVTNLAPAFINVKQK